MPTYYVMDRDKTMAETVAAAMPSAAEIASCKWLTEDELDVYVSEYGRTGFQGGLQGYRRSRDAKLIAGLHLFSGRTIDVPSSFIGGKSDWGVYQNRAPWRPCSTRPARRCRTFIWSTAPAIGCNRSSPRRPAS